MLNNVELQYNTVLMIEVSMNICFFSRMPQSKAHFLLNMNNNNNEE